MNFSVVFTTNNARILKGDAAVVGILNPDLSAVTGVPPHYWKQQDGKIVPMTSSERAQRDAVHARDGVDNVLVHVLEKKKSKLVPALIALLVGAALIVLKMKGYL